MRPKGLSHNDIENILNFNFDESSDDENEETEEERMANLENVIEESLQSIIDEGSVIEKLLGKESEQENIEREEEPLEDVME